jgi:hypothetical protein
MTLAGPGTGGRSVVGAGLYNGFLDVGCSDLVAAKRLDELDPPPLGAASCPCTGINVFAAADDFASWIDHQPVR